MHHRADEPLAAASPAALGAALTAADRLVGYEAVLDAVLDRFGDRGPTACLGTTRLVGDQGVPSVIVVLDDEIAECWLTGNTVWTATSARPGADG